MKLKRIISNLLTPIRFFIPHETANNLGLYSIQDDRIQMVMDNAEGRIVDIACGANKLVKLYGNNSVGVDIFDFGAGALIVENSSKLPFADGEFDTASIIGALNHIPYRKELIAELKRVIKKDGKIVITMIGPTIGYLRHRMQWVDKQEENRIEHIHQEGELDGMSSKMIITLFEEGGFRLVKHQRFQLGLNNLYVFQPNETN